MQIFSKTCVIQCIDAEIALAFLNFYGFQTRIVLDRRSGHNPTIDHRFQVQLGFKPSVIHITICQTMCKNK